MQSKLFEEVVQLIDLSSTEISSELNILLQAKGFNPETLTIEELRAFALQMLDDVFLIDNEMD